MNPALALLLLAASPQRGFAASPPAMVFFNGGMGSAAGLTPALINGVRASGMNTMVIFNLGVDANGNFSGGTICSNGVYTGPSNWGSLLAQCRAQPSSVTRIEMCIGGWTDPSWVNIKNYIAANGTNSSTVLYQNLLALKNALGIDAIDNDDESAYDPASTIKFGLMCASVGLKSTLCPYTNPGYWQAVKAGLGTNCDQVYLQCYDGGSYNTNGNNIATWNTYFGGLKVVAGYWDWERDNTFLSVMQKARNNGASGGFLWPSCTGCNPPADGNEMAYYATQILDVFNPTITPVTAAEIVGGQAVFTSAAGGIFQSYQWRVIRLGMTNNIPGATNATLTLSNLQLTNTASYQLVASNSSGVVAGNVATLTVSSAPSPVNNVVTSYAAQTGLGYGFSHTPSWTLAPNSIINGQFPSSTNGNYSEEVPGRSVNSLTDGSLGAIAVIGGTSGNTSSTNLVTCGNGSGAGSLVIYALTNTSAGGYNLTNITVYGGWGDAGRDQQACTVYYSKVSAPATFISLGSVNYNPVNAANAPSATRATLAPATGWLATNVAAVKFDFMTPSSENGYCGYSEIALYGVPLAPVVVTNTLPVTAVDVVGGDVTFTAGIEAANPLCYQWQKISGGLTNTIAGATNITLILTNLQLGDTASYQLRATNASGVAVSAPGTLTVNIAPVPVNNLITAYAAQTGLGGSANDFYTTWTVAPGSLIQGLAPSSVGPGNFSDPLANECGTVTVLTDGTFGYLHSIPGNGGSPTEVACGGGAGQSVTYALTNLSASGFNLTNITVYGGWGDAGRDQQAYTVYYSKVAAPSSFILLGNVNYNPVNLDAVHSATRAILKPASGFLATNVAALKIDFTTPSPENGYCGYSEIQVFGVPAVIPPATNPTNIMFQANGNSLTLNWPSDHIGWRLQVQTNSLGTGLGTNWVEVADSAATNQMTFPINPASDSVFYRLIYP